MFLCKGGFYCPTAVSFMPCPSGSYCPVREGGGENQTHAFAPTTRAFRSQHNARTYSHSGLVPGKPTHLPCLPDSLVPLPLLLRRPLPLPDGLRRPEAVLGHRVVPSQGCVPGLPRPSSGDQRPPHRGLRRLPQVLPHGATRRPGVARGLLQWQWGRGTGRVRALAYANGGSS
jgi:hypothetical protein